MLHVVPMFFYTWLRKPRKDASSLEEIMKAAAEQLRDLENENCCQDDAAAANETCEKMNKHTTRLYEPMQKVPFMSLDLNLDETERSSDDDYEDEMEVCSIRNKETLRTSAIQQFVEDPCYESMLVEEEEIKSPRIVQSSSLLDFLSSNKELSASPAVVDLVARVSEESPLGSSREPTTSSPGSPASGTPPPVILHRTPIPTEIYCMPLEDDENDAAYEDEILDPTDALIYGWIHNPYLKGVAEQMNTYLASTEDDDDDITNLCRETTLLIHRHPMSCQVKYKAPEFDSFCYPLSYFGAAGWLEGCRAAYQAFPEAIGQEQDSKIGLPLHYACLHQANFSVVQYLVETYPEATRVTNAEHQTPLHQACRSKDVKLNVVALLLKHYPTAAQLADLSGYTPLHLAIRYGASLEVLAALQASSPTVIRVVTLSWHRPLHIAALYGASLETVQWLVQKDPSAVRATAEDFSTVLHYAVAGDCAPNVVAFLRDAYPLALGLTNEDDETPWDVARRVSGISLAVLQLVRPPAPSSHPDKQ